MRCASDGCIIHAKTRRSAAVQPCPADHAQRLTRRPALARARHPAAHAVGRACPARRVPDPALWDGRLDAKVQWTFSVLVVGVWLGCVLAVRERVVYPMQTLTNLLAALREGDYSLRSRRARRDDALGEVMREINALGETLIGRRREATEATALLRAVMAAIDVAVFTFDDIRPPAPHQPRRGRTARPAGSRARRPLGGRNSGWRRAWKARIPARSRRISPDARARAGACTATISAARAGRTSFSCWRT